MVYVGTVHVSSDLTRRPQVDEITTHAPGSMEAPEQCGRAVNRGGRGVLEWAINYLSTSFQVSRDWDGRTGGRMGEWIENITEGG